MKVDITILVPAIRKERWVHLYNSIKESTKRSFELIIVGPHNLPDELQRKINVKYIKDFGNPVRASQIGSLIAEGKYIFWASDDGTFQKGALDKAMDCLENQENKSINDVVISNYREEGQAQPDDVLRLNVAYPKTPYIPDEWYQFNVATMYTEFFHQLGGYDCSFEACPLAYADISARAQRAGANILLLNEVILDCTHMPGTTGDHAPIHYAHLQHDEPHYKTIYNNPNCVNRTSLDLQNWRLSPTVWSRRFRRDK
tara:strand:- start:8305 stop:9075 length:771 start_codon:yes stop_codon:yes gene_type:complete